MSNVASKKTLIIMVAVFVLPVVLAKLALDNDWFTKGATNKGQLLAPTIDMSALLKDAEPKWRLLYVMPNQTDLTDFLSFIMYIVTFIYFSNIFRLFKPTACNMI